MISTVLISLLLITAVGLCWICGLGMLVAKDAYTKLQFTTPVASIASVLIVVAVCIGDSAWQSRMKAILIAIVLIGGNAVISQATARALRVREEAGANDGPSASEGQQS